MFNQIKWIILSCTRFLFRFVAIQHNSIPYRSLARSHRGSLRQQVYPNIQKCEACMLVKFSNRVFSRFFFLTIAHNFAQFKQNKFSLFRLDIYNIIERFRIVEQFFCTGICSYHWFIRLATLNFDWFLIYQKCSHVNCMSLNIDRRSVFSFMSTSLLFGIFAARFVVSLAHISFCAWVAEKVNQFPTIVGRLKIRRTGENI